MAHVNCRSIDDPVAWIALWRRVAVGLLVGLLLGIPALASCQNQGAGHGQPDSTGWREKSAEADRLRIERELPVVRAQARTALLRQAGRFAEALQEAGRASALALQVGDSMLLHSTQQMEGRILVDLGRYAEALTCLLAGAGTGGIDGLETDIALCRLKLGNLKGARTYDVRASLVRRFGDEDIVGLPGVSTSARLEASLWLDRSGGTDGDLVSSRSAIAAVRIVRDSLVANYCAGYYLNCLGQRATAKRYLLRAAAGASCRAQLCAKLLLTQHCADDWNDRYRQGTMPPPPGEGIDPVPDP